MIFHAADQRRQSDRQRCGAIAAESAHMGAHDGPVRPQQVGGHIGHKMRGHARTLCQARLEMGAQRVPPGPQRTVEIERAAFGEMLRPGPAVILVEVGPQHGGQVLQMQAQRRRLGRLRQSHPRCARDAVHHQVPTTLRSGATPSSDTSITSPGFSQSGPSIPPSRATPAPVPEASMSPGRKVRLREI